MMRRHPLIHRVLHGYQVPIHGYLSAYLKRGKYPHTHTSRSQVPADAYLCRQYPHSIRSLPFAAFRAQRRDVEGTGWRWAPAGCRAWLGMQQRRWLIMVDTCAHYLLFAQWCQSTGSTLLPAANSTAMIARAAYVPCVTQELVDRRYPHVPADCGYMRILGGAKYPHTHTGQAKYPQTHTSLRKYPSVSEVFM